jgi:hypothetical protein
MKSGTIPGNKIFNAMIAEGNRSLTGVLPQEIFLPSSVRRKKRMPDYQMHIC